MNRLSLPPLLLALALLAGCTTVQPAPDAGPTPPAPPEAAPPEAAPARPGVPVPELVATGEGRGSALGRLDRPARAEAEPFENRHVPGQIDTLRTYHYDGMRLEVYDVAASPRALLQALAVTSDAYDTGLGFRVGATRAEVEAALGDPDARDRTTYEYALEGEGRGPGSLLTVRFAGDRVRELAWGFYVD